MAQGATSGNVQKLVELRYDCDADTLLALVHPAVRLPYRRAHLLLPARSPASRLSLGTLSAARPEDSAYVEPLHHRGCEDADRAS